MLRNDIEDTNFDPKWEPGLLDLDLRISTLQQQYLRGTNSDSEDIIAKKRSHLSTASFTSEFRNQEEKGDD